MAARCFSSLKVRVGTTARPAVCRAGRELWYPGAEAPAYLDGSMPGDFGFDPLRLGANAEALKWYQEAELYNGRWCMMGVLGIAFTDIFGVANWWETGTMETSLDLTTLTVIELAVIGAFELKRYENIKKTGMGGLLNMVPFDPVGLDSDQMRLSEVKNGRLAMLSFLGYVSQHAVTGKGPIENLTDHLADPNHNNAYTSSVGPELTVAAIACCILPITIEARKSLVPEGEEEDFNPIPW